MVPKNRQHQSRTWRQVAAWSASVGRRERGGGIEVALEGTSGRGPSVRRPSGPPGRHLGAIPGVDAEDITVDITPQDVVIKAASEHKHIEDKGQVHRCEFTAGQVFRSLRFPRAVDATKAKAEYQNGMLNITVPIAPARARRVDIEAA